MSLLHGLKNMIDDLERGKGKLQISMTDYSAFELGKNVATTEGKVVFENRMFQLLQYSPLTENVHQTPLLIVPPWINKFYILDLQEKNSLIHRQPINTATVSRPTNCQKIPRTGQIKPLRMKVHGGLHGINGLANTQVKKFPPESREIKNWTL